MLRNLLTPIALASSLLAIAQGGQLNILFNVQHAICGNATGGIVASVWGGAAPYTLSWTPTPPQGQGTNVLTDVPPGTYTLTVTDNVGNELSSDATVILTPDLFPPITSPPAAWSCAGACDGYWNYYVPLSGANMPYTVTFDPVGPGGGASPNGFYFNSLCSGESYAVTVSDINGCTGTISGLEVVGPMNPEIVSLTVTPACPGGSNGGFVVEFAQADSVVINPGQTNGIVVGNVLTANNLAAGMYMVYVSAGSTPSTPPGTSGQWCSQTFQIEVPETNDPCGSLSGVMYADLDGDCTQNGADVGIPYRVLTVQPGAHYLLTAADGQYNSAFFYGSYALNAAIPGYDALCPDLPADFTFDATNTSVVIDVAMDPLNGPDAFITLQAGVHRPGFPVAYTLTLNNDGPYAMSDLTVSLTYDPLLIFTAATGSPVSASSGNVEWLVGTLEPFSTQQFVVDLAVPPTASLIGTVVNATAGVSGDAPDGNPANDSYSITRTIIGAYDPNDKLAATSSRASEELYFLDLDAHVDYTIRFQNTGTAEAINVHLTDTISPLFDLASLQILGASHPFTAHLLSDRVLRFDFQNINLPDSTSDLLGSQGFASFRLRPVNGLAVGESLENAADIYFDFNEPIRTNTSVLTTEFSVGLADASSAALLIQPNPASDMIVVSLPGGVHRIELLSTDGRLFLSGNANDRTVRMPLDRLPQGLYLVRATDERGCQIRGRFVKQ
ncbi:MAG TPA: T9SS type A sorting domain-containing protein [Flavobacteriales bacterium]|nr:T9SS type A sorting domain-containing protein [Flavobacteriales bacterium]